MLFSTLVADTFEVLPTWINLHATVSAFQGFMQSLMALKPAQASTLFLCISALLPLPCGVCRGFHSMSYMGARLALTLLLPTCECEISASEKGDKESQKRLIFDWLPRPESVMQI